MSVIRVLVAACLALLLASSAHARVIPVSSAQATNFGGSACGATGAPPSLANGQLLIFDIGTSTGITVTAPAGGWTEILPEVHIAGANGYSFWAYADGTQLYNFTFSGAADSQCRVSNYSGTSANPPIEGTPSTQTYASTNSFAAPTNTTRDPQNYNRDVMFSGSAFTVNAVGTGWTGTGSAATRTDSAAQNSSNAIGLVASNTIGTSASVPLGMMRYNILSGSPTVTNTPDATNTPTQSFTNTPTTPTDTPTSTNTPTNTFTRTNTPTNTFTRTATPTQTFVIGCWEDATDPFAKLCSNSSLPPTSTSFYYGSGVVCTGASGTDPTPMPGNCDFRTATPIPTVTPTAVSANGCCQGSGGACFDIVSGSTCPTGQVFVPASACSAPGTDPTPRTGNCTAYTPTPTNTPVRLCVKNTSTPTVTVTPTITQTPTRTTTATPNDQPFRYRWGV